MEYTLKIIGIDKYRTELDHVIDLPQWMRKWLN